MACWVLRCPNCSETFVHSEIQDTLANFFSLAKPEFPEGGQMLTCMHCGKESLRASPLHYLIRHILFSKCSAK